VSIQQRSATIDALGDISDSWTTLITAHAEVRPLSARELFAAQATQSQVSHQVTVRYRPELATPQAAATYRVLFGARVFDVHGVMNIDERNREIRMMCSEGLSNG
jgi:SPP1 family predicted phage head-tail adaptor